MVEEGGAGGGGGLRHVSERNRDRPGTIRVHAAAVATDVARRDICIETAP